MYIYIPSVHLLCVASLTLYDDDNGIYYTLNFSFIYFFSCIVTFNNFYLYI